MAANTRFPKEAVTATLRQNQELRAANAPDPVIWAEIIRK